MGHAVFAKCQCESLIDTLYGDRKSSKERVTQMFVTRSILPSKFLLKIAVICER